MLYAGLGDCVDDRTRLDGRIDLDVFASVMRCYKMPFGVIRIAD